MRLYMRNFVELKYVYQNILKAMHTIEFCIVPPIFPMNYYYISEGLSLTINGV